MTERTRLISYSLYGLFSAGRKTGSVFQYPFARTRGHSRSCSLDRENSGRAIETRRDSRNSFFENETIFVFITPRSRANLTLTKKKFIMSGHYLALINRAGGLYGRILTEVVSTDRTQWGLYIRLRSRFSHTDRLSSVNKMFIIWHQQEQFNVTGL